MSSKCAKNILTYFKNGGNVLCPMNENGLNSVRGICCKNNSKHQKFWVKQNSSWINFQGKLTSDLILEQFPQFCKRFSSEEKVIFTPGFYYSSDEKISLPKCVQQSKLKLEFIKSENTSYSSVPSESILPIYTDKNEKEAFDFKFYISNLKTRKLGRTLIYVQTINSTFDVLEGNYLEHGLTVITDQQLQGRGRGQNKWLSPKGCAMTSFQIKVNLNSRQGQKASLLQHLTSLAVVYSLKDKLLLKLKWPNDIYYGAKVKMGGVVVLSSIFKDEMIFNIGLGFNLDNSKPTLCVNNLLEENHTPKITREEFFAEFFNCLESFFDMLQTDEGLENILNLYHEYWLHQDQQVQILNAHGETVQGVVKCIDSDGYLKVELGDGRLESVQPGNNSFDMMQGLILPKK